MKRAQFRSDGMKQIVHTGHKTFDEFLVATGTGNVVGSGQHSSFVRAKRDVETWAKEPVNPGYLRDFDLQIFGALPSWVRRYICEVTDGPEAEPVILYKFFHLARNRWGAFREVVHGYIVADRHDFLLRKFYTGPTCKSYGVIDEMAKYVTRTRRFRVYRWRYRLAAWDRWEEGWFTSRRALLSQVRWAYGESRRALRGLVAERMADWRLE